MVLSATDQNTKFLILADVRVDVPTVRTSVRVGCRTPPLLQRPRLSRFTMDLWFNAERQRPNWGLSESSIICALTHLALPKKIVLKMDDLLRNRMQKKMLEIGRDRRSASNGSSLIWLSAKLLIVVMLSSHSDQMT